MSDVELGLQALHDSNYALASKHFLKAILQQGLAGDVADGLHQCCQHYLRGYAESNLDVSELTLLTQLALALDMMDKAEQVVLQAMLTSFCLRNKSNLAALYAEDIGLLYFKILNRKAELNIEMRDTYLQRAGSQLLCMQRQYPRSIQVLQTSIDFIQSQHGQSEGLIDCYEKLYLIALATDDAQCDHYQNQLLELYSTYINYHEINCNWDKVRQYSAALLKLTPSAANVAKSYGMSCWFQGDYEEAIVGYTKAISLNPSDGLSGCKLAYCYYATQQFQLARMWCNELLRRYPRNKQLNNLWIQIQHTTTVKQHSQPVSAPTVAAIPVANISAKF